MQPVRASCRLLLLAHALGWSEALSTASLQPTPLENANSTDTPDVTLAEKQAAEEASKVADSIVSSLEHARDEAWRDSRANLAVASSPPIRSESVFALLSTETDRFAKLEESIRAAKADAAHKRRLAELVGGAWDARESRKLKVLRARTAAARSIDADLSVKTAFTTEADLLRELAEERLRGAN